MSTTASKPTTDAAAGSPWEGFRGALWQREINVRAFIQLNYTPYEGDASFLAPATARTKAIWEQADGAVRRGAQEGRARHLPDSEFDHRARARLHRPRPRNHRRPPDRGAAEARHHAERRAAHGAGRARGVRLHAGSARGGSVHQVPEDAQRGRVRRVHGGHPRVPQFARADGPAGRLRARPHHRRLPARGALRRGPADRAEEAGEAGARSRAVHRGHHPRSRRTVGADHGRCRN